MLACRFSNFSSTLIRIFVLAIIVTIVTAQYANNSLKCQWDRLASSINLAVDGPGPLKVQILCDRAKGIRLYRQLVKRLSWYHSQVNDSILFKTGN